MENHTIVTLKKGEGRTIKAGGAWIFDNEIDTITGTFKNGDVVNVHDFDGYPMGKGFINQNSKIRIRMMTRHADQDIDTEFLRMRVQNAWDGYTMSGMVAESSKKHEEAGTIEVGMLEPNAVDEDGDGLYRNNVKLKVAVKDSYSGIRSIEWKVTALFAALCSDC